MEQTRHAVREIIVIGGGGHAKVLISVLKKSGYNVRGYTDAQDRGAILGAPYLGKDGVLTDMVKNCAQAAVGVGKIDASPLRLGLQERIAALGFEFPVICSPYAVVNEEVLLGAGTAVFDGVVITSGAKIGRTCIVNTSSTVEHDCLIGDNVHIAPGVTLGGGVTIGDNCMIGAGANIVQAISVCGGCLIGAGATVVRSISARGTYIGNPAKRIG